LKVDQGLRLMNPPHDAISATTTLEQIARWSQENRREDDC
jgi:hypothetical protein